MRQELEKHAGALSVQRDKYTHTGLEHLQKQDKTIVITITAYTLAIQPIVVEPSRARQVEASCSPLETGHLRARLGSGGWVGWNLGGDIARDIGYLQGRADKATVQDLLDMHATIGTMYRYAKERTPVF